MCKTVTPQTPSGKVELYCQALEDKFGFGFPRYAPALKDKPYTVISPSSSRRTNATFGGHQESLGTEKVEINPYDAAELGVKEGELVKLTNVKGEVILRTKITDAVKQGVIYTPKGTWLKTSETGQTINALIDADVRTDIMSGVCYNETFVNIEIL